MQPQPCVQAVQEAAAKKKKKKKKKKHKDINSLKFEVETLRPPAKLPKVRILLPINVNLPTKKAARGKEV